MRRSVSIIIQRGAPGERREEEDPNATGMSSTRLSSLSSRLSAACSRLRQKPKRLAYAFGNSEPRRQLLERPSRFFFIVTQCQQRIGDVTALRLILRRRRSDED